MLNLLLALSTVASASDYPVGEWLAPADYGAVEAADMSWSGFTLKNVYVGRGETRENWSRRITTWSSPSDTFGAGPVAARAAVIQKEIIADCPGARTGELRSFSWSGRPAAEFWIACRLFPETGRPDHYLVRLISGEKHLLSAAISFRAAPRRSQINAAGAYLDTLIICTEATAKAACRRVPVPPRTVAG